MIVFVSGGARCGKSSFAESLSIRLSEQNRGSQKFYLATAQETDAEMSARIKSHVKQRHATGYARWKTIEEPYLLYEAIEKVGQKGDVVLIDCLTTWVSQVRYSLGWSLSTITKHLYTLMAYSREKNIDVIFVSNDVNEGNIQPSASVRDYLSVLESVHHQVVQQADNVIQMVAGIPQHWKEERPLK